MAGFVKFTKKTADRVMAVVTREERDGGSSVGVAGKRSTRLPPQQLFGVRVTIDGGTAGSAMADCSWTYTAKFDSGYELGTGLTPAKCRLPEVPYEETPANSWGTGFFDKDGAFVLWDANECPQVEDPCEDAG